MATELHVVTGDQYRLIDRRMRDIKRQLDQVSGSPLDPEEVACALQKIVEGDFMGGTLPPLITLGTHVYEILGCCREEEKSVSGFTMEERAKEMGAHLGQVDGIHLLNHQAEIPEIFRGKIGFIFTDWFHPNNPHKRAVILWDGRSSWALHWYPFFDNAWRRKYRVLRRKSV